MKPVLWVAAAAALLVAAVVLWPSSKVALAPDAAAPATKLEPSADRHFHDSAPAGPTAGGSPPAPDDPRVHPTTPNGGGGQPNGLAPTPPSGTATVRAARGAIPPGAGSLSPDGGPRYLLTKEGIKAAVQAGVPEIRDCYEQWLRLQPDLGGKMKIQFTIDTDDGVEGKVTKIGLGDAGIGHAAMEGCVLQVFGDLRFEPPLNGELNVTYPLVLASSPPDAGP